MARQVLLPPCKMPPSSSKIAQGVQRRMWCDRTVSESGRGTLWPSRTGSKISGQAPGPVCAESEASGADPGGKSEGVAAGEPVRVMSWHTLAVLNGYLSGSGRGTHGPSCAGAYPSQVVAHMGRPDWRRRYPQLVKAEDCRSKFRAIRVKGSSALQEPNKGA